MPLKNIKERKRELRAYYKKLRAECPQDIKQDLDKELTQKLLWLDEYKNCDTLFAFVSMPIECDTSKIIDNALLDNKRVIWLTFLHVYFYIFFLLVLYSVPET